jgi:hypothetical protein
MKDIVIPYLRNNSGELEACIALIKKNFPHRNIYVVEEYEKTLHSSLSHINQILKLKWAIENLDLTNEFYLFNDDFFVLEPVDGTPYYHRGTLDKHIVSRHSRGMYTRALIATSDMLGDGLSYELHIPFLFDKRKLSLLIQTLRPNIDKGKCPLVRSYYGNIYSVGGEYMDDVKDPAEYADMTYLSTTEASFRRKYGDLIRSKI